MLLKSHQMWLYDIKYVMLLLQVQLCKGLVLGTENVKNQCYCNIICS